MHGQLLYEAWSHPNLQPGDYIHIDGPHDKFGRVIKTETQTPPLNEQVTAYLVRGTEDQKPPNRTASPYIAFSTPTACGAYMKTSTKFIDAEY
jgi:hypothetical protein